MENFRLHDSARTYGSNHLTNNLSVTALKGLLPVFLMMIFMGIGTDVLGQESLNKGIFTFSTEQLKHFGGKVATSTINSYTSEDGLITLSTQSKDVQANGVDGTKVRPNGVFTITTNREAKITKIFLETNQNNYQLTSDPEVEPVSSGDINDDDYTYTFNNVAGCITFTNKNSSKNISVTAIQVNYEYPSSSLLPQLEGTFSSNVTDFKGKQINIPALTVTANGSPVNINDYTVTYTSSNEEAVIITDNKTLNLKEVVEAIITATITPKDETKYVKGEATFNVTVEDPTVFKVPANATDYNIGKVLATGDGNLCVTLGGWMFPNPISGLNAAYGTTKEILGGADQHWGSTEGKTEALKNNAPDNYPYLIAAGDMNNPRNEFGNNSQPQSINVYNAQLVQQTSTLIDPMFNVPTSGSYLIFEPKTNGTVAATIMQNGVFDVVSGNTVYRPQRRVFVLDEAGTLIQSTPQLEVDNGKFPDGHKDLSEYTWNLNGNVSATAEQVKSHFGITNFQCDDTNFQNGVYECLVSNDILHNSAVEQGVNFKGATGWSVMVPAPVTYTFNVKAGKTYYLYNFGSRIGLFGFSMKESNPIVDDVTYKEKENNTVTPTADGHVAQVSLDRKFAVGKWNSAVLPFSLNKQQVDAIFGQTYDKNHEKGTQILYFEKTDSKYVYYTRHAYNTIVAGKPFLIKPCGKDANGNNVVTREGDNIVLNTEKITAFPYVTIENIEPAKWGRDTETADYYWHSAYNVETVNPGDYYFNGEGSLVMRENSDAKIQAFRGFLKKKTTAQAKLFSVAYFNQLSDNSDIPSKIEGVMMDSNGQLLDFKADDVVYNLSGQVVTTDASSLYSLPKGIYIVNGKKYVVE